MSLCLLCHHVKCIYFSKSRSTKSIVKNVVSSLKHKKGKQWKFFSYVNYSRECLLKLSNAWSISLFEVGILFGNMFYFTTWNTFDYYYICLSQSSCTEERRRIISTCFTAVLQMNGGFEASCGISCSTRHAPEETKENVETWPSVDFAFSVPCLGLFPWASYHL